MRTGLPVDALPGRRRHRADGLRILVHAPRPPTRQGASRARVGVVGGGAMSRGQPPDEWPDRPGPQPAAHRRRAPRVEPPAVPPWLSGHLDLAAIEPPQQLHRHRARRSRRRPAAGIGRSSAAGHWPGGSRSSGGSPSRRPGHPVRPGSPPPGCDPRRPASPSRSEDRSEAPHARSTASDPGTPPHPRPPPTVPPTGREVRSRSRRPPAPARIERRRRRDSRSGPDRGRPPPPRAGRGSGRAARRRRLGVPAADPARTRGPSVSSPARSSGRRNPSGG
jgi:hypothetical protein